MKEQEASKAYAKAIYQLSKEQGLNISDELVVINELISSSNDLENLLFLEIFTPKEKTGVMAEVFNKLNTSKLLISFINLLINEKRIGLFPMIFKNIIVMDDHEKGFLRGTIEGANESMDQGFQEKIINYLKKKLGKDCQLKYVQSEKVTAGFKVTVEDLQLDASLDNQLNKFKKDVLSL